MKKILVASILVFMVGCGSIASFFTPVKKIAGNETQFAKDANKYFWDNYHQGNYENIPLIIERLNLALQENPNDLRITAHLAFTHIWALTERQRVAALAPSITEQLVLSKRYFEEANAMDPHDPRLLGFLADLSLAEGQNFGNKKEQVDGYFKGLKSIKEWPQFNKFTLGYIFSNLDKTDKHFKKGIEWQYETMDDCSCEKNTRATDYQSAIQKIKASKDPKIYRTCWNTWIAPHNFEGFCLNWGDMLVKNGDLEEAVKIYSLAKQSDSYNEWPYKGELEKRIANVKTNEAEFNKPVDNRNLANQNVIMFNSRMSCTGCHQMSENEFAKMGYKELGDEYYFLKK